MATVQAPLNLGSTCQALAHHARRGPDALAVKFRDVRFTYLGLAGRVLEVMDGLAAAGIRPGQILGVETGDRIAHLVILLAAEALGITTMSLSLAEMGPPASLDRLCGRIIVSRPPPGAEAGKYLAMPPAWLAPGPQRAIPGRRLRELERDPEPDALVRLTKSSGTTGLPKVMGMTYRVQQRMIAKTLLPAPPWVIAHPVYLCLYNFAVRAAHSRAMLTLQLGGTVHLTGADAIWHEILAGVGNYALLATGDLERFVRFAPYGRGPFQLCLDVIGAPVPPRLLQETRARVTGHIVTTYSSNETARISVVDDNNVGTLFPDVRVRILGEDGKPVPMGQAGTIHVKTDTMVDGYIGAPDLTRAAFAGGWFRTSDIGFQPSAGKLVVLGRTDGMLNLGGVKIAAEPIEQRLKLVDGVRDALVTSTGDPLESQVMLVAIEAAPDADPAVLRDLISPIVRSQVAYFQLAVLPAFPRTETGKIRREEVKLLCQRQAQRL